MRERIVEIREVRARDLLPNPKNWRLHPHSQRAALEQALEQVGNVDVLRAVELPDGRLQLFDGHLRRDVRGDDVVKVAVCDLTEEEADLVLATFDPIASMAETSREKLAELSARAEDLRAEAPDLLAMLDGLLVREEEEGGGSDEASPPPREEEIEEKWAVLVTCRDEEHQREILDFLLGEGLQCSALIS